jgi:transcriptional regulator with XRE-family HTH domain
MAPRIDPRKEYESPINEYRVAAGLTHKELAAETNISSPTICSLANGTLSPIREKGGGQLRKDAKKLCEFFNVGPEDLFPRYVCSLNRSYKFEIQPYETWSERAADNCGVQLENRDLAWLLIKKGMIDATPREIRVFIGYLFNNETFADIARKECVTTTRVIDNFKKSLRRITDAAQKTGLPIDTKIWWLTMKQRFG